mmetsp:Transcript_110356/g.191313  ORF Transcript_110356/g.191313 Transcript_110356/m.191313 type:complete len:245 (-) Transcript_110356:329-1063(-)
MRLPKSWRLLRTSSLGGLRHRRTESTLNPLVETKELRREVLVLQQRLLQELQKGSWLQLIPLQRIQVLLLLLAHQASTKRMARASMRQSVGAAARAGADASPGRGSRQKAPRQLPQWTLRQGSPRCHRAATRPRAHRQQAHRRQRHRGHHRSGVRLHHIMSRHPAGLHIGGRHLGDYHRRLPMPAGHRDLPLGRSCIGQDHRILGEGRRIIWGLGDRRAIRASVHIPTRMERGRADAEAPHGWR